MQIGDPKKASILAIVAIIILGAAVFRILPKAEKITALGASRAQDAVVTATEVKTNAILPKELTSNPFGLKTAPPPTTPSASLNPKSMKHPGSEISTAGKGSIPPVVPEPNGFASGLGISGPPSTLPSVTAIPGEAQNPSDHTGNDRNIKKEPSKALTLNGVMKLTRRTAIVTIDGNEDEPIQCQVGSVIDGYKVLELTDSQMTLKKGQKTLQVSVGNKVDL